MKTGSFRRIPHAVLAVRYDGTFESSEFIIDWVKRSWACRQRIDVEEEIGLALVGPEGTTDILPGMYFLFEYGRFAAMTEEDFNQLYERKSVNDSED